MRKARRARPALSIVVAVFDEQESVELLYEKIRDACDLLCLKYEVVFVDDGSRDQTFAILEQIHIRDPRLKVIKFRSNYGQTAAMAAGFRAAQGETIISMDGDLQNDPADIPLLLAKLNEGYDLVCGWRKDRKDKVISRKIPSVVANRLIQMVTGIPIHDNGCSLKGYRSKVIKQIALYSELHRFIPALSAMAGARISEVVVRHHHRKFGRTKYGLARVWRVFLDLFLIKMLTRFATRPALWFGTLSVPPLGIGMGCLLLWLVPGISGLILPTLALLLLSLAGHLTIVGLLGEMVLSTGNYRPEQWWNVERRQIIHD